jgi:hypothetical protein
MSIDNGSDDSAYDRILTRTAHLMPYSIVLFIVVHIPYYFGVRQWSLKIGLVASYALIIVGLRHLGLTSLCVRCMSAVPADAAARARGRERPALWLCHRGAWFQLAAVVGTAVLAGTFRFPDLLTIPIDVVMVPIAYATWRHHLLRPWCPYCRGWDDDGGITEPSPDPMVQATR